MIQPTTPITLTPASELTDGKILLQVGERLYSMTVADWSLAVAKGETITAEYEGVPGG